MSSRSGFREILVVLMLSFLTSSEYALDENGTPREENITKVERMQSTQTAGRRAKFLPEK